MKADIACIPSSYSRLIARVLKLQERDLPALLQATQLTTKQFLTEDLQLTACQQIQILQNSLQLSDNKAFGLEIGRQLTPPTHGAMGFLANSSPNFLTALQAFQTYSPTRNNFSRIEAVMKGEYLECYYHIDLDMSPEIERYMCEAAAMSLFECAKFIVGRELNQATTYFSHSEPQYSQYYYDVLPGDVHFDNTHTFVRIPLTDCLVPNISANHENYQLAMQQCEQMLSQLNSQKDSSKYQVQKILLSYPPGQLSEECIAAELFISKRTLARRLAKEDTSFRQLREEILSQQAAKYLNENYLSVEAIAALLNYHDSSNFRRAFKRWFGMSPDQFRKKQSPTNSIQ